MMMNTHVRTKILSLTHYLLGLSADLQLTFANRLDPADQAQQNVQPDLDPILFRQYTLMVFLKETFKKVDFEKIGRRKKGMNIFLEGKDLVKGKASKPYIDTSMKCVLQFGTTSSGSAQLVLIYMSMIQEKKCGYFKKI